VVGTVETALIERKAIAMPEIMHRLSADFGGFDAPRHRKAEITEAARSECDHFCHFLPYSTV
tara:strand:+ start:286 stop:471 length:186 start_codon:yes stop_codon:yes gene_type:complete